jgi:hypothetical protein
MMRAILLLPALVLAACGGPTLADRCASATVKPDSPEHDACVVRLGRRDRDHFFNALATVRPPPATTHVFVVQEPPIWFPPRPAHRW